jgi:hypothetical protein
VGHRRLDPELAQKDFDVFPEDMDTGIAPVDAPLLFVVDDFTGTDVKLALASC